MPAQLVALDDGPSILIDKPILLIGRHPECDVQIDSRKISRRHCCIAQVNDYLVVRDLGSTNGIRINGVRVLEGRLRLRDELTVGSSRFRVEWDMEDEKKGTGWEKPPRAAVPAQAAHIDEDDELLESCDEPIPLADPEFVPSRPIAEKPVRKSNEEKTERPATPPESLIIPDELNLAPSSDVIPPPPRQS
jgi:predicted component of type VI protein secretion system